MKTYATFLTRLTRSLTAYSYMIGYAIQRLLGSLTFYTNACGQEVGGYCGSGSSKPSRNGGPCGSSSHKPSKKDNYPCG